MDYHTFLVTYDISDPKRWRKVFQTMKGFGEHVQLSVFRCDLTPPRQVRLSSALDRIIHHEEDQVIIAQIGPTSTETLEKIEVLGRSHTFDPPEPTIF